VTKEKRNGNRVAYAWASGLEELASGRLLAIRFLISSSF
jgi:hypothetical protein